MRIFYGWWVLLGIFLIYTANNGILIHTLPLIYPELIKEFGWNQEEVTRPAQLFFLVAAMITPFMGVLFDRYSTRMIIFTGSLILVVALCLYPFISSLQQMLIIYLVFAVGLAGCGIVPNMLILTRWFNKYRGIAVGVLLMGSSFGGAIFPLIARETLVTQGWREAMVMIAIVGTVMMLVPVFLFIRNYPGDLGLKPDGINDNEGDDNVDGSVMSPGLSLKEAVKTPAFYLLAFSTGALWFCIVGVLQHQSIYMTGDLGVDIARIPSILSVFFWCAIIGKLLFGYLCDIFNKMYIMLVAIANLGAAIVLLRVANAENMSILYIYAVVCGIGFSAGFTMVQIMIAEFFSGASFGKILGLFAMIDSVSGSMGIKFLGEIRVARDSYHYGLDIMVGLCVISACCIGVLMFLESRKMGEQVPV